jgi:hypothetical protein
MIRPKARIWYSRGLSNVYDALRILRESDTLGELTLLTSHARREVPAMCAADEGWLEPSALSDEQFVDWCVDACRTQGVDVFVPGRRVQVLSAASQRFTEVGTRLLVPAGPEALGRIDRKDHFYVDMAGHDVALPDYRIASTADEFDAACAALRAQHARVCVKPVVSTFGLGFHTLVEADDEYRKFLGGDPTPVSFAAARRAIAAARRPRELMVMEYLPGPERSVDCLAQAGTLVTAVSRVKRGEFQVLETEGPGIEAARAVVRRYGLDGIVNVQTRDSRGETRLLESNARMSGGLLYACASGVAFPYWAVRLALGWSGPADVPTPRAGLRVAPTQGMLVVGSGDGPMPPETLPAKGSEAVSSEWR